MLQSVYALSLHIKVKSVVCVEINLVRKTARKEHNIQDRESVVQKNTRRTLWGQIPKEMRATWAEHLDNRSFDPLFSAFVNHTILLFIQLFCLTAAAAAATAAAAAAATAAKLIIISLTLESLGKETSPVLPDSWEWMEMEVDFFFDGF